LGRQRIGQGNEVGGVGDEVTFVGVKGEDETAVPAWVYVVACFDDTADGGVAIFEGVLGCAGERTDRFVEDHFGRELAAIDEHFSACANGGGVGLDKDLIGRKRRQGFFMDFDLIGLGEDEGLALHGDVMRKA